MQRLSILFLLTLCNSTALAQVQAAPASGKPNPAASATAAAAQSEQASPERPSIQHLPINELSSGAARLRFAIPEPDRTGTIIVRWKTPRSGSAVGEARARRQASGYLAALPAEAVQPPGLDYWVVERREDGEELAVFASASDPHTVRVFHSAARRTELALLRSRGGKRSTVLAAAEFVDFGERQLNAGAAQLPDRYYRLETGYAYAFLTTVEEIELRVVRVRGEAADQIVTPLGVSAQRIDRGIDYGRSTVTLRLSDGMRLSGSVLLGASQEGFEYGSGGALIFGDPRSIHVTLSAEGLTTLGFTSGMRMGFLAAERVPMSAGVEVSNFPIGDDTGVRLIYEAGYELTRGSTLMLRAGFQGRTSVTGGPTLGMSYRHGF